jgi:probable F420-dependent oxidoreductase
MEIGIALPHLGKHASRDAIKQVAIEAEALGFDGLWVLERLLRPTFPIPQFGHMAHMSEHYAVTYDPIDTLTFVAAVTDRIKLGTSIIDALFHIPVTLARRFATLDQLSNGRVIAGLGQGANEPEFQTANVSMKRRGSGFEEFIAAMRAAWSPDPVKFEGRFYTIPESQIGPKPVQANLPIIIGGSSPAAIERAARIGDGLNPVGGSFTLLTQSIAHYRQSIQTHGRDLAQQLIIVRANGTSRDGSRPMLTGSVEEIKEDIAQLTELGVNHAFLDMNTQQMPIDDQLKHMAVMIKAAKG